jgi:hypothetical protein
VPHSEHSQNVAIFRSNSVFLVSEPVVGSYLLEGKPEILVNHVVSVNVVKIAFIRVVIWKQLRILGKKPFKQVLFSSVDIIVAVTSVVDVLRLFVLRIIFLVVILVLIMPLSNKWEVAFLSER